MFINSSGWAGGMENVARAIDNAFGECLRIIPTKFRPNFQPLADNANAFEVVGTFTWQNKLIFKQNSGHAFQTQEPVVESREPIFSFSRHNLPVDLQVSWQIERLCDGNMFEMTGIEPDGVSRIIVRTVQLGRQTQ